MIKYINYKDSVQILQNRGIAGACLWYVIKGSIAKTAVQKQTGGPPVRNKDTMNFQYFFINQLEISQQALDIGFELYSAGHLIWLAVLMVAAFLISNYYKNLDGHGSIQILSNAVDSPGNPRIGRQRQRHMRQFFAVALACSEMIKDAIVYFTGFWSAEYLPFHLCGLAIFTLLADAFCENQKLTGQLIAYAFMPGAMSALLFCNWTEYPFLNFMNIHSFVFHGGIVFYMVMRYRNGEIRPTYRGLWVTFAMVAVLVGPLFWFNTRFDTNFLFLNEASEGSPLVPIWNLFGAKYGYPGYLAGCAALVIVVFHGLYLLYSLLGRRSGKRK